MYSITLQQIGIPLTLSVMIPAISAGFPSPADDMHEEQLNIHEYLVTHPAATFFMRIAGEGLPHAHIICNDVVVVDRSLTPRNRDVVVAVIDGELRLVMWRDMLTREDVELWGVVTGVVRTLRSSRVDV